MARFYVIFSLLFEVHFIKAIDNLIFQIFT